MGSVSSPVLVGREPELARLLGAVETAAAGQPQLVVIAGDAGIGKSRLVAEAAGRLRGSGSLVLVGGCLDIGDRGIPYLAISSALRSLARTVPPDELETLLGPTRDDLATIAPELAGRREEAGQPAPVGSVGQARLFERVLELVGRLGAERPVVVVLEDVHWIDRATRDLVTFVVRNLSDERVAAFLTVRTDDLPPDHPNLAWLAELDRARGASHLPLAPLDREAVAAQLAAINGVAPPDDLVDRIWRQSEGNPFFAEELLATEGRGAGTLVEILRARLRGLDPVTHDVVVAVALAGRAVDERLVAAVVDLPLDALRAAVHRALERHVLREEASGAIALRHGLLRDVVASQLLVGERRDVHERLARALEAQPALRDPGPATAAAELAHHWATAGRIPEAYPAAIAAAQAAEAVYAYPDAYRRYVWALELETGLPEDRRPALAERLELRRRAAESADLAGELDHAITLTTEALRLAEDSADAVTAGLLHARLGYLRWATGDNAAGLEAHRTAVALVPAEPPSAARARVLGGLAASLMGPGGYEESAGLAKDAITCAEGAAAIVEEARARNVLGLDLVALGRLNDGIEELRRSRDLAASRAPADVAIVAHYNLGLTLAEAGLLADALEEATTGRAVARRAGLERRFGFDLAALAGDVLLRLGRWTEADTVTAEALRLDRERRASAFLFGVRGRLEALRGDIAAATAHLDRARDLGAGEDPDLDAYVVRGVAEAALAAAQPREAARVVETGLSRPVESHAPSLRVSLLALGARAAADLREAAGRRAGGSTDLEPRAARLIDELAAIDRTRLPAATVLLLDLAETEMSRTAAPDAARWAFLAGRFDVEGDRYLGAYARLRAAEADLRASGTRADAGRYLGPAAATAYELGAVPLLRELTGLARRARITLDAVPGTTESMSRHDSTTEAARGGEVARGGEGDGHAGTVALRHAGLSPREIEVLRLVAAGRTNGEIAERLFISRKTAGVHVTHILDKLDVANRVEAAMVAARLGLEPEADD